MPKIITTGFLDTESGKPIIIGPLTRQEDRWGLFVDHGIGLTPRLILKGVQAYNSHEEAKRELEVYRGKIVGRKPRKKRM